MNKVKNLTSIRGAIKFQIEGGLYWDGANCAELKSIALTFWTFNSLEPKLCFHLTFFKFKKKLALTFYFCFDDLTWSYETRLFCPLSTWKCLSSIFSLVSSLSPSLSIIYSNAAGMDWMPLPGCLGYSHFLSSTRMNHTQEQWVYLWNFLYLTLLTILGVITQ